eukprot:maker-scaffold465_size163580-snap-gene-0.17 protein:Tk03807 transcript:maker-scaffold465_size163580-snap-gene-0.17-mRNA-1 annotation:"PREDICTED: latrophilin-2-like"
MVIACEEGTQINVVRANFGRFSGSICNDFGENAPQTQDWSVNCLEPRSLRAVNERCNMRASCEIPVTSALFGDPCPGTHKYLEVHYTCQAVDPHQANTTPNPLPPWLLDLAATPIPTKIATHVVRTEPVPALSSTTSTTTTTPIAPTLDIPEYDDLLEITMNEIVDIDDDLYDLSEDSALESYCPPVRVRNLFWNWTMSGYEAIQVCPSGTTGFAKWFCSPEGKWSTDSPNMGDCQSLWLNHLQSVVHSSMESAVKQMAVKSAELRLYGGDLPVITGIFQTLTDRLRHEHHILSSEQEKEEKLGSVLESVAHIVSNLLHEHQSGAWQDVASQHKRSLYFNGVLQGLTELATLYAESINVEMRATNVKDNLLSEIRVLRSRGISDQHFPDFVPNYFPGGAALLIPSADLVQISQNGAVRTVFNLLERANTILPPFGSYVMNSKLLTIGSTEAPTSTTGKNLASNIRFTMRHYSRQNIQDAICATWEASQRSWSTKECFVIRTNVTHTSCSCSRMGSYAILTTEESVQVSQMSQEEQKGVILGSVVAGALLVFVVAILLLKFVLHGDCLTSSKASETSYPPLTSSLTLSAVQEQHHLTQRRPGTYLQQAMVDNNPGFYSQYKGEAAQQAQPQQPSIHTIYRTDKSPALMMPFQRPESHIYSEIIYNQLHHSRFPSNASSSTASPIHPNGDVNPSLAFGQLNPLWYQPIQASQPGLLHCDERNSGPGMLTGLVGYPHRASSMMVPQQLSSNASTPLAITLQDGDQFVRLSLEDPYNPQA